VNSGGGWVIYSASLVAKDAPVAYSLTYPLSPVDFLAIPPPDQEARLFGTKELLP
jgi:hypothetical protein